MTSLNGLISPLEKLLTIIVSSPALHAKWLNTLSFLENCGARKIAACEHPTLVKEEILKHAAEEFRHAHYLKNQIKRISKENLLTTYSLSCILGGIGTLHYLTALDIKTSRYLKTLNIPKHAIKEAAYLLVTYAIELRAQQLYRVYDTVLRKAKSPVTVKSILLEEHEHLNEMIEGLKQLPSGFVHAAYVCKIEQHLYQNWFQEMQRVQYS